MTGCAGDGEHGRHRLRLGRGEALPEQGLDIAERDSAIDRPPRREGDEQALRPVGIADRGARLEVEQGEPFLEPVDPAGRLGIDHQPLAGWRLGLRARARLALHRDRLRRRLGRPAAASGDDPEEGRRGAPIGEQPAHRGEPGDEGDERQREQRSRAAASASPSPVPAHNPSPSSFTTSKP